LKDKQLTYSFANKWGTYSATYFVSPMQTMFIRLLFLFMDLGPEKNGIVGLENALQVKVIPFCNSLFPQTHLKIPINGPME
jgi:hypothetical protein